MCELINGTLLMLYRDIKRRQACPSHLAPPPPPQRAYTHPTLIVELPCSLFRNESFRDELSYQHVLLHHDLRQYTQKYIWQKLCFFKTSQHEVCSRVAMESIGYLFSPLSLFFATFSTSIFFRLFPFFSCFGCLFLSLMRTSCFPVQCLINQHNTRYHNCNQTCFLINSPNRRRK